MQKKKGRPTKYDPALMKVALWELAKGGTLAAGYRWLRVTEKTLWNWRQRDSFLAKEISKARHQGRRPRRWAREVRAASRALARGDLEEPFSSQRRLLQYRLLHPRPTVRHEGKDIPIGIAHLRGICGGLDGGCEECERLERNGSLELYREKDGRLKQPRIGRRSSEEEKARAARAAAQAEAIAREAGRGARREWERQWAEAKERHRH
jgi:hypothetical protein